MSLQRIAVSLLGALLCQPAAAGSAGDAGRLAADQGCINCHGPEARSAPSLDSLAAKLQRKGDSAESLQHLLKEMRGQSTIHGHRMVSDESALAILGWLAHGKH